MKSEKGRKTKETQKKKPTESSLRNGSENFAKAEKPAQSLRKILPRISGKKRRRVYRIGKTREYRDIPK